MAETPPQAPPYAGSGNTSPVPGPVRVSVYAKTDLGRTRDHNEDTYLIADLSTGNVDLLPEVQEHVVGPRGSLFMVADGMGGAAAGELASAMAVETIHRHLATAWRNDVEASSNLFAIRVREAVELANHRIHRYAIDHPDVRGMGTTVTAAGVYGSDLFLAQIGDSRGYLIRKRQAIQLTKDQSLMQRLVDAGEITEEEAEHSEHRNIILQALGPDQQIQVDLTRQPIRRGDVIVLCSDGLSGQVRREEIGQLVDDEPDLKQLCEMLIELANTRGGPDNITVIAARFDGPGLPEPNGEDEVGYRAAPLPPEVTGEMPVVVLPNPGVAAPGPTASASETAAATPPAPARPTALSGIAYLVVAGLLALLGYWLMTR